MALDDRLPVAVARLAAAMLAVILLIGAPPPAAAADEQLLLEVIVNDYPIGKIGQFVLRDGALFARPAELTDLGFRVPEGAAAGAGDLVPLSALRGVAARLDQSTQTLHVVAATDRLMPALLLAGGGGKNNVPVQSGTGATLDYDAVGTMLGGQRLLAGQFDLRAFSPWGVLSSGSLARFGNTPTPPGTESEVRLDTTATYSDPDELRRYRLGDVISGGLSWTRPVRLGGAQIASDFSLRPDLVTFPLPLVAGSVAVPSTVDVMVNGVRAFSREVQPGPFQIPQLPVVTGAGTVSMTVTNALGRQVTTVLPFYASSSLLDTGLQSLSAEAGMVRRDWGTISNDYGSPAGSATYRRGLTSFLTVEGHAESTGGLRSGGAGLVVGVGSLGVVNLSAAASNASAGAGRQFSAGVQHIGRIFSFGGSATVASHNFGDIAATQGDPVPRFQLSGNAGVSLGRFGSLNVAYAGVDRDRPPAPLQLIVPTAALFASPGAVLSPAQHAHIATASYTVQIYNVSLFVTGFRDFVGRSTGLLAGLTLPLGTRSSASVSAASAPHSKSVQAQASQTPVTIGDWGYQAFDSAGQPGHQFAQAQYKSPWALLSAGADRIDHRTTLQGEAQGAVSFVDGGVFPSNTINDSFAIVDTNGVAGVRVLDENLEIGRTDSAGRLLVPNLRSYEVNHIGIDPNDVPLDTAMPFAAKEVRPQDRSGVVVNFPLHTSNGALLRLTDDAGKPLPLGSVATLKSSGVAVPVGYEGEAYVEGLEHHYEITVELPKGRHCTLSGDYRPVPGEIPTIGPLPCRESSP